MIAADEYYSKQRLEPPGSRASWKLDWNSIGPVNRIRFKPFKILKADRFACGQWLLFFCQCPG